MGEMVPRPCVRCGTFWAPCGSLTCPGRRPFREPQVPHEFREAKESLPAPTEGVGENNP